MSQSVANRNVAVIQHSAFEDIGIFGEVIRDKGWNVSVYNAGIDDLSQPLLDADLAILLGGPIGAYETDRYPFLVDELHRLERRLATNLPTLGICLGAQLIASALGARAYPGACQEIGWGEVQLTTQGHASCISHLAGNNVLHWHGDTFDLPTGADRLASTRHYENQAFSFGNNVLAMQFHAEIESSRIEQWLIGHTCELANSRIDVPRLRASSHQLAPHLRSLGAGLLCDWLDELLW